MDSSNLRERLHEYIDIADEQHLTAIYVLVGDKIPEHKNDIYTEEVMNMLYQRRENHRKGVSKSYTAEESINNIKKHKK